MKAILIKDLALDSVTIPHLYGEPSQHIIVRLRAEDGTTGWGEISDVSHLPAMMPDVRDLESCLGALLIGRDAMNLNQIEDAMQENFPGSRFHGKAVLARAGVSIAAHDLKARLLGIPVYDLLGGKRRERIPICYPIFRLKSRADVADRVRLVKEQFHKGFTAFRFYFWPLMMPNGSRAVGSQ